MKKPTLFIVFLTVFIDVVGFSIIFPLFPAMLDYYLEKDGVDSLIGSLVAWLEKFAGDDENAVATLFGGILGSLYGVLQFVFAPIWVRTRTNTAGVPRLSLPSAGLFLPTSSGCLPAFCAAHLRADARRDHGRKHLHRLSRGCRHYLRQNRASGMIIIGVALGLGFILGPAIGGFAHKWQMIDPENAVGGFNLHPFSGPAAIALMISALNWVLVVFKLSESLPPEKRGKDTNQARLQPVRPTQAHRPARRGPHQI